jgi:hypothetical protein
MNTASFKSLKMGLFAVVMSLLSSISMATTDLKPPTVSLKDPIGQELYDKYPWSLLYYYGITGSDSLVQIFEGNFHRWPEHIQSIELERTLNEDNMVRRFFSPIVGVVQLAGAVTMRNGSNEHTIYEVDPYINFRWANLPWNHYLTTSLSLGEGVSYASSVPAIEKRYNQNTKRLLNLLVFEATFAAPSYPQLQFVARLHHRSGAFGLYRAGNSGSNDIGLGIRYMFD